MLERPVVKLILFPFRLVFGVLRFPCTILGYLPILGWVLRRLPIVGRLFWPESAIRCDLCHQEFTLEGGLVAWEVVETANGPVKVCRRRRCQSQLD